MPITTPLHRLHLGPDWKPVEGDVVELRDFSIEIMGVTDDGSVSALRLRFKKALSSPLLTARFWG